MTIARIVLVGFLLAITGPAFAVHDDGVFQLDGDVRAATCGTAFPGGIACTGDDWDTLYTCADDGALSCTKAAPGVGNGASAISDLVVDPAPLSIFTGGGSKDELDIVQWRWKDGSVPDKDNLIMAFAALYEPTSGPLAGDKIITFGANRHAVNGDAQIGFWFFQKEVSLAADGTFQASDGSPARHEVGDVLILSNFVQGGGSSNIQVYVVNTVNTGPSTVTCPAGSVETSAQTDQLCLTQIVNGTAGVNGVCNISNGFPADVACAATNGAPVAALDPDFVPKSGAEGFFPTVGFFEGGLNLTDVGLGAECFPTFAVETRSSQSITAVLKDFTLGKFENCEAAIHTEIHALADNSDPDLVLGGPVVPESAFHDMAIVTGTAGAPLPTGNVQFRIFYSATTPPACTGAFDSEVVALSPAVPGCDPGETCAVTSDLSVVSAVPGYYSYDATYLGDGVYGAVGPSACEPLAVSKFNSVVQTHLYLSNADGALVSEKTDSFIDLAGSATLPVRDQAIVSRSGGLTGPTPTGTVTFTRYPFSNCTGDGTVEVVSIGSCPAGAAAGSACSALFNLGPNTLGYRATYNGDANYNPSLGSRCEPVCAIDTTQ